MKPMIIILSFLLLLFNNICFAQEYPGAKQIALSHSDVALAGDPFSIFNNPAGLSEIKSNLVGFYYSPSPFGLSELANGFGALTKQTSFGIFSLGFMKYGFELYKETKFALGYANNFAENFSYGLVINYKNISIKNYGSKGFVFYNAGGIAKLSDEINIGFSLENFSRTTINDEPDQIPVVFWFGVSFNIISDLTIFSAVQKELNFNPSLRFGAEYFLTDFLQIRFGTSREPDTFSGGVGISYLPLQFDYAVSSHPDLGFTHQFSLSASF
jgi:hypothetical protein